MQQINMLETQDVRANSVINKLDYDDRAFHDWYRFVLSFPAHLVREYIQSFELQADQTLLDPFCGTGTTVVEARLAGLCGIGVEANPMTWLASSVKTRWNVDPQQLLQVAHTIATAAGAQIEAAVEADALRTLPEETQKLLLKNSISPLPLHKALILRDCIDHYAMPELADHLKLAFAKSLVQSMSNLHFGPEVGVKRKKLQDVAAVDAWLQAVTSMAEDLLMADLDTPAVQMYHADARYITQLIKPQSIDAVFTSPPYPNEKDYTRTTRLESVLLGFIHSRKDLREVKQHLLRSNTRNVYKHDQDDQWIRDFQHIQTLADTIEQRRIALGKTSGFERLYARTTRLYFGGMFRHLEALRPLLKPGARLGYVVGDQASYLQILIHTGQILAEIAQSLGYVVEAIDLFRTRLATATRHQLREEVVVLRWPGRVGKALSFSTC